MSEDRRRHLTRDPRQDKMIGILKKSLERSHSWREYNDRLKSIGMILVPYDPYDNYPENCKNKVAVHNPAGGLLFMEEELAQRILALEYVPWPILIPKC